LGYKTWLQAFWPLYFETWLHAFIWPQAFLHFQREMCIQEVIVVKILRGINEDRIDSAASCCLWKIGEKG